MEDAFQSNSRTLCSMQDTLSEITFKEILVPIEQSTKQIDDDNYGVFCLSFMDSIIRGLSISGRVTQAIIDKLMKDYAFEIFLNSTDPTEAVEFE